ncbi:hypothetical protein [Salinimicrobium gaetbulicola]|uniref:Uncharacterized protein n=1 Tax=Salinimicrobium gaetbulicola TaxID=999702 RepID=A0ABW3IC77_9FLAO
MNFLKKITLGILIVFCLILVWVVFELNAEAREEAKFLNVQIPGNMSFEKPVEFLTDNQIDSLESMDVNQEKIVVVGNGYNGYDFYMWHKPTEKGEIYIKAFELTQYIQLSREILAKRTKNEVRDLSGDYKLYKGTSVIYEGTFSNFYPTRFELWFKSKSSGIEEKLTDKNYLIDGWDR